MKNIKKYLEKNSEFYVFLFLNLLFYGMFSMKHYSADSYLTEIMGWMPVEENYYAAGRWLMALFCIICERFRVSFDVEIFLSWLMAILSISGAQTIVLYLLKSHMNKESTRRSEKIWEILLAFMMISNVFLLEDFIFAEYTGVMCLGILFDVLGAKFVVKSIEERKISCYILGILVAILGINAYQGNFAIFVMICVLFVGNTFDGWRNFLKNNVIIGFGYLIPAIVNVVQVHLGGSSRASGGRTDIIGAFLIVTNELYELSLSTANFLVPKFYVLSVMIFAGYFLYQTVHKKRVKAVLFGMYYCLIALLGVYAPFIVTNPEYIDVVPRTVYIWGGIIPIILITLELHVFERNGRAVLPFVFVFVFLIVQYWGVMRISFSHFKAIEADKYESQYIVERLKDYEKRTGITVEKIALYWDNNVTGNAAGVVGYRTVNERMLSNDWAAPFAIQCLTGWKIAQVDRDEKIYEKYFEGNDWNDMDEEQIIIVGDTLHYCSY